MKESFALSSDLAWPWTVVAVVLALLGILLLASELIQQKRTTSTAAVVITGLLSLLLLTAAVLRPVRVKEHAASTGARVLMLLDASRSMDLPGDGGHTRRVAAKTLWSRLNTHFKDAQSTSLVFGSGPPKPYRWAANEKDATPQSASDLSAAFKALALRGEPLPDAAVVVSDGRLDRPAANRTNEQLKQAMHALRIPVHTIPIATTSPNDATIMSMRMPPMVVAHQPAVLTVELGCVGDLVCEQLMVTARELHLHSPPVRLASATAQFNKNRATVALELMLDRVGTRILQVAIEAPDGDSIADNNRRWLTVAVARDRVRLLHVAGRPTYDVRALRTWLKSDASIDVVAFFILRSTKNKVRAAPNELSLIEFPVDELFTKHLQSFDVVVLQDFDAQVNKLQKHLPGLARYVRRGGGLIMVGGPSAFVGGSYAGTALEGVLPVELKGIKRDAAVDLASFVPRITLAGRHAPVLKPMRALLGSSLPDLPGTNRVGDARDGATVLFEHPALKTRSGKAMPVLALGEYGSGRSIALTVDSSHKLLFSRFALGAAGRAHGAFWDALLGWLVKDPRFESARVRLKGVCMAGVGATVELRAALFEPSAKAQLVVQKMGSGRTVRDTMVKLNPDGGSVEVELGQLDPGGYTATVRFPQSAGAAASRYDFACEVGGDEWADPRPDPERLRRMATATGGVSVDPSSIADLPVPLPSHTVSQRSVQPVLPPWLWSLMAAVTLGLHWIARRQSSLP